MCVHLCSHPPSQPASGPASLPQYLEGASPVSGWRRSLKTPTGVPRRPDASRCRRLRPSRARTSTGSQARLLAHGQISHSPSMHFRSELHQNCTTGAIAAGTLSVQSALKLCYRRDRCWHAFGATCTKSEPISARSFCIYFATQHAKKHLAVRTFLAHPSCKIRQFF